MSCFKKQTSPGPGPDISTSCRGKVRSQGSSATLKDLIDEYCLHERETEETTAFTSMPSIEYAIERAGMAENDEGKRYSHQYRLKRTNMANATAILRHRAADLRLCESFDELHDMVRTITDSVSGLGPLYTYDTARRLGAKLGIEPKRVYLHAGTRAGAKALGLDYRRPYLPVTDFPEPLRTLSADMIESFLCIYKDKLAKFAAR
jgi:hypothetical protein